MRDENLNDELLLSLSNCHYPTLVKTVEGYGAEFV